MSQFHIEIPDFVRTALDRLRTQGHSAYIVGGSLRDLMLGGTPNDWDVTTSARPEQTLAAFADLTTIPTGLKHGTVTVLLAGEPIEITTYRVDGTYTDSRRPDSVTFTDRISEDLARRDFTVNAMAYSPEGGLVDLYGGREDLAAGILRAVGEPRRRFTEDALRILRGFRFSAQLDFAIEPQTLAAMGDTREGLRRISAERILAELSRLLTAPAAPRAWEALCRAQILPLILPHMAEGQTRAPEETARGLDKLPRDLATRLAWLFFGMAQEDIRSDLNALKPPTRLKEDVLRLTEQAVPPADVTPADARRLVRRYGELTDTALSLWRCAGYDVDEMQMFADAVRAEGFCRSIADLAVNGGDLIAVGVPRGRMLGETLAGLLEYVTDHPEDNRREILLDLARPSAEV